MKKLLFTTLVAAGLLLGYGCKKKDTTTTTNSNTTAPLVVEEKNKAIFFDFSETWCHVCGSYAVPAFDKIMDDVENTTVCPISVCKSSQPSGLNSKYSADLNADWQVKAPPSFFVNNSAMAPNGGVYTDLNANVNWVKGKASTFSSIAVNAAVALDKKIEGTTLTIRTKSKFYADFASGSDYRIAIYVLEDNIKADQVVDGANGQETIPNVNHRNILRGGPTATYKGDAINNKEAITANQEFDKTFSYELNLSWNKDNIKVVAVIWDATNAGAPEFVNCNMVK
ncbi:MAG: Omp28-related outer membrane protein [Bacteroidetes bacterium]|nr:Omp28-related outer membrane protein [Bacteroidota bacterium]